MKRTDGLIKADICKWGQLNDVIGISMFMFCYSCLKIPILANCMVKFNQCARVVPMCHTNFTHPSLFVTTKAAGQETSEKTSKTSLEQTTTPRPPLFPLPPPTI